jgi:hypothetical protein
MQEIVHSSIYDGNGYVAQASGLVMYDNQKKIARVPLDQSWRGARPGDTSEYWRLPPQTCKPDDKNIGQPKRDDEDPFDGGGLRPHYNTGLSR